MPTDGRAELDKRIAEVRNALMVSGSCVGLMAVASIYRNLGPIVFAVLLAVAIGCFVLRLTAREHPVGSSVIALAAVIALFVVHAAVAYMPFVDALVYGYQFKAIALIPLGVAARSAWRHQCLKRELDDVFR